MWWNAWIPHFEELTIGDNLRFFMGVLQVFPFQLNVTLIYFY